MKKNKIILLLILIGFLVYFKSLFNDFVWDDEEQIVNNSFIHSLINLPYFFQSSTFNPGGALIIGGAYYKPLMMVFFSVIYNLFGPKPFFFHLFQIILHTINSVLVFYFFDLILKKINNDQTKQHKNSLPAFFLSLIFLVHPQNTESAIYISALQEPLFFFFGMTGLLIAAKKNISRPYSYGLINLFLLLSLLAKETGFIFFIIIFLYFWLFKREEISSYFIFSLLTIWFYGLLRFVIAGVPLQKNDLSPIAQMNFWQRIINVPAIIFFYLKIFFCPINLAIDQHWVIKKITFYQFYLPLIFDILFFLVLIGFFIFLKRKKFYWVSKVFLFFLFWFVLSLGFHLNLFPLDMTVSDRWFYLPMVGILGIGETVFVVISQNVNPKKNKQLNSLLNFNLIINVGLIILITLLPIRTIVRTFDWQDGLTLYRHDIKISQNSFDLENNLGVELFRRGKINQAKTHFERSIKLAPYWWTNWNNLGVIYEKKGDYQKAEKYYKKAIDNGNYYLAYENYVKILIKEKKISKPKSF